jgi:hypothetical protein
VKALEAAGLAELQRGSGPQTWTTTQRAHSLAAATAAKPITRATAEAALAHLLERVKRVNRDSHFLGKVTRVIVGSYLRADMDRLRDVDVAIEVAPKQADRRRLRQLNLINPLVRIRIELIRELSKWASTRSTISLIPCTKL